MAFGERELPLREHRINLPNVFSLNTDNCSSKSVLFLMALTKFSSGHYKKKRDGTKLSANMKVECFYFLNTSFINKCLAFWLTLASKVITIMERTVLSVVLFDQDSF